MDDKELKDEMGQLATRLDNVEGYFCNFDTTLNNHMTEYKETQKAIRDEQRTLMKTAADLAIAVATLQGSEGLAIFIIKWVVTPLIGVLAALIGVKLLLPNL